MSRPAWEVEDLEDEKFTKAPTQHRLDDVNRLEGMCFGRGSREEVKALQTWARTGLHAYWKRVKNGRMMKSGHSAKGFHGL